MDQELREKFFEDYKEIEDLWEILSPSPELRDHIDRYKRLAELYAVVRNAYAESVNYIADLAAKTRVMVEESATLKGLLLEPPSVNFDVHTIKALQDESGTAEAKVFNLVRNLRAEMESNSDMAPVLLSIVERADRISKDLQERAISSVLAMVQLEALAMEKEVAVKAAQESGLSPRAFAVYWTLRADETLMDFAISAQELARKAETLLARFPNAAVNADEHRKFRASLYIPLLGLPLTERRRIVDTMLAILLDTDTDVDP